MRWWHNTSVVLLILTIFASSAQKVDKFTVEEANKYIQEHKNSINETYRPKYHFTPPVGWTNDPNGLIYYKGEYHLFYQFNPYDSLPGKMHWGHAKSKDLIVWEHLPVALAPDQHYDRDGAFSGSAIEKDGKLYLMYTGNSGDGQVQCMAVSEDGIHFEKIPENPVLDAKYLPENAEPRDFRDPKVVKHGNLYYAIVASKTKDNRGQVLLFKSPDLIKWEFKSTLLEGTSEQGVMWECPDLFELDGKDVLILSPIQIKAVGNDFQNIHSVIEFIGKVDWERGTMSYENMKELDHGLDFYATQSLLDDKDRRIAISWMNMWRRNFPTHDLRHGWQGAMTLPREMCLVNNSLVQIPVFEIENYYRNPIKKYHIILNDEIQEIEGVSGEVAVLELSLNVEGTKKFDIEVRANDKEKTVISYNGETKEIGLDRSNSGIVINGAEAPQYFSRKVKVADLNQKKLQLKVFLDQSSVEVFVNGGDETLTATVFPTKPNSGTIRFKAEGRVVIEDLNFALIKVDNHCM